MLLGHKWSCKIDSRSCKLFVKLERHFTRLGLIGVLLVKVNNYSPKWRWLAVDIYTEVNSCFSICLKQ